MRIVLPILSAIVIITVAILAAFYFKVDTIKLNPQNCLKEENLALNNKLLFLISEEKLKDKLKKSFPCASNLKITKIYPNIIEVQVNQSESLIQISNTNLAVSSAGLVTEHNIQDKLPIYYPLQNETTIAGQKITGSEMIFVLEIAKLLPKTDFHPASIRSISASEIAVYDAKEAIAIFSPQKDANTQVDSLQQTVAAAKIDGDKIAKIALRFDKPVITFK